MYTKEEAEGKRLKNPFDTITEGIGINRITKNFMMSELDGAYRGTDQEAVEMSRSVLIFWLRSSSYSVIVHIAVDGACCLCYLGCYALIFFLFHLLLKRWTEFLSFSSRFTFLITVIL
jgi:hypothetical protein